MVNVGVGFSASFVPVLLAKVVSLLKLRTEFLRVYRLRDKHDGDSFDGSIGDDNRRSFMVDAVGLADDGYRK